MEQLAQAVWDTPTFTRCYIFGTVALLAATTFELVRESQLGFVPNRIVSEWWRLVTSFLYFGPLKFNFFVGLYFIHALTSRLEQTYSTKLSHIPYSWRRNLSPDQLAAAAHVIELNRTIDFYYLVVLASTVVVALVSLLHAYDIKIVFLGPMLNDLLLYLHCKYSPDTQFLLVIFTVPATYFPYVNFIMNLVLSGEFFLLSYAFHDGFGAGLRSFAYLSSLWKTLIGYGVAHLWWFTKDVLMDVVHASSEKDELRYKVTKQHQHNTLVSRVLHFSWYELLQAVLLLPVYWMFFYRINRETQVVEVPEMEGAVPFSAVPVVPVPEAPVPAPDPYESLVAHAEELDLGVDLIDRTQNEVNRTLDGVFQRNPRDEDDD